MAATAVAWVMASKVDVNYLPIDLQWIKEDLIAADLINQLDIAYGLKQLLINNTFTVKSLLYTPTSELAKILGIDDYVASLINNAVRRLVHQHTNILLAHTTE
jgi:hypothetical protein